MPFRFLRFGLSRSSRWKGWTWAQPYEGSISQTPSTLESGEQVSSECLTRGRDLIRVREWARGTNRHLDADASACRELCLDQRTSVLCRRQTTFPPLQASSSRGSQGSRRRAYEGESCGRIRQLSLTGSRSHAVQIDWLAALSGKQFPDSATLQHP